MSPDVLSSKTKKLKQITFLCHSITNTNRHDFLATHFLQKKKKSRIQDREYFLCSKFLLIKTLRGYFFAGIYFYGTLEKSQKLEPAKISCHTVASVSIHPYSSQPAIRRFFLRRGHDVRLYPPVSTRSSTPGTLRETSLATRS